MTSSELAKQMGVSVADVEGLLRGVVNTMKVDGSVDAFLSSDEDTQTEIFQAYGMNEAKKAEKIQTTYMTNPAAREQLQRSILATI